MAFDAGWLVVTSPCRAAPRWPAPACGDIIDFADDSRRLAAIFPGEEAAK